MTSMVKDLKTRVAEIEKLANDVNDDSHKFQMNIRKDYNDLDRLLGKAKSKDKDIKQLKSILSQDSKSAEVATIAKDLQKHERSLTKSFDELKPSTGSFFVRLCLGQVNVKHYRYQDKMKLKEEYHKFKKRTDILAVLFVGAQLFFFPGNRILQIASQAWLMYYYASLSLRENILKVNGSHIRGWWIYHHYIMMAVTLGVLTWNPNSESYTSYERAFLTLNFTQSLVQILQTWYQSHKLYKMIAMGDASTMDVNSNNLPKTSGPVQSLTLLIPFLILVQIYMVYNGCLLLKYGYERNFDLEWQVPFVGLSFIVLGFGNMANTLDTYVDKLRGRVAK